MKYSINFNEELEISIGIFVGLLFALIVFFFLQFTITVKCSPNVDSKKLACAISEERLWGIYKINSLCKDYEGAIIGTTETTCGSGKTPSRKCAMNALYLKCQDSKYLLSRFNFADNDEWNQMSLVQLNTLTNFDTESITLNYKNPFIWLGYISIILTGFGLIGLAKLMWRKFFSR